MEQPQGPYKRILVTNISSKLNTSDILKEFNKFGKTVYIEVTSSLGSTVVIEFESPEDAETAVRSRNGYELSGKSLEVKPYEAQDTGIETAPAVSGRRRSQGRPATPFLYQYRLKSDSEDTCPEPEPEPEASEEPDQSKRKRSWPPHLKPNVDSSSQDSDIIPGDKKKSSSSSDSSTSIVKRLKLTSPVNASTDSSSSASDHLKPGPSTKKRSPRKRTSALRKSLSPKSKQDTMKQSPTTSLPSTSPISRRLKRRKSTCTGLYPVKMRRSAPTPYSSPNREFEESATPSPPPVMIESPRRGSHTAELPKAGAAMEIPTIIIDKVAEDVTNSSRSGSLTPPPKKVPEYDMSISSLPSGLAAETDADSEPVSIKPDQTGNEPGQQSVCDSPHVFDKEATDQYPASDNDDLEPQPPRSVFQASNEEGNSGHFLWSPASEQQPLSASPMNVDLGAPLTPGGRDDDPFRSPSRPTVGYSPLGADPVDYEIDEDATVSPRDPPQSGNGGGCGFERMDDESSNSKSLSSI